MIGTTMALIGLAAAKLGSSAIEAHNASSASSKASQVQQDAAKQAQQIYSQQYADAKSTMAPYYNAGTNSMNMLGALMTPGASIPGVARSPVTSPNYQYPGASVFRQPMQRPMPPGPPPMPGPSGPAGPPPMGGGSGVGPMIPGGGVNYWGMPGPGQAM